MKLPSNIDWLQLLSLCFSLWKTPYDIIVFVVILTKRILLKWQGFYEELLIFLQPPKKQDTKTSSKPKKDKPAGSGGKAKKKVTIQI